MSVAPEFYEHDWDKVNQNIVLRIDLPKDTKKITNAIYNQECFVEIEEGVMLESLPTSFIDKRNEIFRTNLFVR